MKQLDDDLDAIFATLDSVALAHGGDCARGFPEDVEAEARLSAYGSDSATRRVGQYVVLYRRGALPTLEALPRAEGASVQVDGVPHRVLDAQRMDDGRLMRLALVRL